jgi:amino-acid N-acetyltransferase
MTTAAIRPATRRDAPAIEDLLTRTHLPIDGLADHLDNAIVAEREGRVVASAALEIYEGGALLRSVAVDPAAQGTGLGRRVIDAAIARARRSGVTTLFLLTTTAERFFPKFGFTVVQRAEVPETVRQSVEFRSACPASAVVMRKEL